MSWPEIYSKVDKQCRCKYLAFIVELVLTELSLTRLGYKKAITGFIHGRGFAVQVQ